MKLVEQLRHIYADGDPITEEAADQIEQLEAEVLEQARIIGMGAEREAAMMAKVEMLERERDELLAAIEDKADVASKALRRAFQLGQIYWQQADSEYYSQNAKADATQAKFQELVDETRAAIARVKGEIK